MSLHIDVCLSIFNIQNLLTQPQFRDFYRYKLCLAKGKFSFWFFLKEVNAKVQQFCWGKKVRILFPATLWWGGLPSPSGRFVPFGGN